MRILLTSTAAFVPPRGGSTRSNRVWLEGLASRGHSCKVVCGAAPASSAEQRSQVRNEAERQGYQIDPATDDPEILLGSGIEVSIQRDLAKRGGLLGDQIRSFRPDWVLVSSEDLSHTLLREAHQAAPGRVVYLAHTPQFFPFGPESWSRDRDAADRARSCAAVVVIGHHMAGYIREHLGREAAIIHPAIYGSGPFESHSNFNRGSVLMVNPCAVKGLTIFEQLAHGTPAAAFAALPGWGTTTSDRAVLAAIPNCAVLQPVRRIEEALANTSVLVMPSLWYEGFGLIVMEAMLRGIPVLASDSGGLAEAKRGTGFVIPVRAIHRYLPSFDEVHMPWPVIPEQSLEPWLKALETLLRDGSAYREESERSRTAALAFVNGLRASAMEDLLLSLQPGSATPPSGSALDDRRTRIDRLSPEQRSILLAKLKASRTQL